MSEWKAQLSELANAECNPDPGCESCGGGGTFSHPGSMPGSYAPAVRCDCTYALPVDVQAELVGLSEAFESLTAERDRLEAENAELRGRERWIPVDERLPDPITKDQNAEMMLVWSSEDREPSFGFWERDSWDDPNHGWRMNGDITYWRPIQPPTDKDEE